MKKDRVAFELTETGAHVHTLKPIYVIYMNPLAP